MPVPSPPKTIYGKIFRRNSDSNLVGATVTFTNTTQNNSLTFTTTENGYLFELGGGVEWAEGDSVTLFATKQYLGQASFTFILDASPGQSNDLTLLEPETYKLPVDREEDQVVIRKAVLINYRGEDINSSNPLPVFMLKRQLTKKMENVPFGQPLYLGEAEPGTKTSSAKWRIRKMELDDGANTSPTGEIWANGNTDFDKVWDNRTDYDYS